MKRTKGFVLAECMLSLLISLIGLSIFALILNENHKLAVNKEREVDAALANHILQKTKIKQILIHDRIYQAGSGDAAEN